MWDIRYFYKVIKKVSGNFFFKMKYAKTSVLSKVWLTFVCLFRCCRSHHCSHFYFSLLKVNFFFGQFSLCVFFIPKKSKVITKKNFFPIKKRLKKNGFWKSKKKKRKQNEKKKRVAFFVSFFPAFDYCKSAIFEVNNFCNALSFLKTV